MAIQWIALCVAAAMICALVRVERPELATAVSLAVGAAVLAMLFARLRAGEMRLDALGRAFQGMDADIRDAVLRGAGISIIADLGAQLCRDAGESALAGRVTLIARAAMLALCLPLLSALMELLGRLAG